MTQQTGELIAKNSLPFVEPQFSSHYILTGLRKVGLKGKKLDFLCVSKKTRLPVLNPVLPRYIDEVQDNLLIDTLSMFPLLLSTSIWVTIPFQYCGPSVTTNTVYSGQGILRR